MAFHNNGRKYYHVLLCDGVYHLYITDGMLFQVDEVRCKRHGIYASVTESNLTLNDAEFKKQKLEITK